MSSVADATEETNRRRSGRVVRKPHHFGDEQEDTNLPTNGSTKRKRTSIALEVDEIEDAEEEDEVESEDSEDDDSLEEPDTVQSRARRAVMKKKLISKPAAKRAKTVNGPSTTLAIRSANILGKSAGKLTKQKARSRPSQISATGLYAEVFGKGNIAEDAAAIWHDALRRDNVGGIRELVNFILQCIGSDTKIENADVEDIDSVPARLSDILEEYAHQKTADYPLASKLKQFSGFRDVLTDFSAAVVHALHNSGILYDEPAVYDNIHIWTATMSGAGYRPFRHTATLISLSMSTALCQIAKELQSSLATIKTQIEAEKKKKTKNKARMTSLQEDQKRDEAKLEAIDALLRDAFDTVYVHRYRDVDDKIRVECVTALGNWIILYRKMFLESQYLRYLGWVLSDPNATTRLEVVKALKALFFNRGNTGALRAFIDRFRARIVEMGARDTDTSVRAEAIELLDRLRNAELIEPDDIDTIGQLIFDNEPRVRKAVARFFVSNIEDLYRAIVDEYDQESYASALPAPDDVDDFMEPTQSWIKFKCLAQTLVSHDKDSVSRKNAERPQAMYGVEEAQSRFMLATQSIFSYMPELVQWKSLAGYLLYDHSGISAAADDSDVSLAVQGAFKLSTGEDEALLEVLYLAFKLSLQQILDSEKLKKSKTDKAKLQAKQEEAASNLTLIIPQLLNKFGSTPEAATSILRLEQLLDIDLIADLQSGEATYETIIENINQQFTSHSDQKVLAEASKAFRTARTYETSKEAADAKVAEIWSDSSEALSNLLRDKNVSARGTLNRDVLREIGDVTSRLAQLAAVSDCTEVLEARMALPTMKTKRQSTTKSNPATFLQVLLQLLHRGVYDEDTTQQFAQLEDRLCGSVMTVLSFYFRWKVVGLKNAIASKEAQLLSTAILTQIAMARTSFVEAVVPIIQTRQPLDLIRVNAILTLLDLFTLFATVRHMKPHKGDLNDEMKSDLQSLVTNPESETVELVMETHEKMEKRLARKTKKHVDTPYEDTKKSRSRKRRSGVTDKSGDDHEDDDIERPPEDSDDEAGNDSASESSDHEDSDVETQASGSQGREARKQSALISEQALCELTSKIVLATIAAILSDFSGGSIKARLQLNRHRLGKSYTLVIAYLDEKKDKKKPKRKSEDGKVSVQSNAATTVPEKQKKPTKDVISEPLVIEDDDIEDEDDEGRGEEGDEDDLRARGLDDDPVEEDGEDDAVEEREVNVDDDDDDDVMGD